jgi:DNA repair photolyase
MSDLDAFFGEKCSQKVVRKECSTALSPSNLPGLDFALNPYTRCGHGCNYCYAPYVMRVSPSEWDTCVQAKMNIAEALAKELPRKRGVIGLGTVTDPYQPVERDLKLTRKCLEIMTSHPTRVSVLTKSDIVVRDADLLTKISEAEVGLTINTSSDEAALIFEPCAPPPSARLNAVRSLSSAGIDTYVFLGPIIPSILDQDVSNLIGAIRDAGAKHIMVDRLNLRPGMLKRMEDTLATKSPQRLDEFKAKANSDAYYSEKMVDIREACKQYGLMCQDAF